MPPKQHLQRLVLQRAHALMLVANGAQVPQGKMVVVQQIVAPVLLTNQKQCNLAPLVNRRLLHDNSQHPKKQDFVRNLINYAKTVTRMSLAAIVMRELLNWKEF